MSLLPESRIRAQRIVFSLFSNLLTPHGRCSILQGESLEVGSLDSEHITVKTWDGFKI